MRLCVITLKITFYYGKLEKYTREIEQYYDAPVSAPHLQQL